jgi:hypothetical protein
LLTGALEVRWGQGGGCVHCTLLYLSFVFLNKKIKKREGGGVTRDRKLIVPTEP